MKGKAWPAVFALALFLVPVVLGSILVYEQFDDDTAGSNPSGSGYSYSEALAGSGVSSAQSFSGANSFTFSYGSTAAFQRTSGEFCTSGERATFKFLLTSWPDQPAEQVGFGLSFTNPNSESGSGQVGKPVAGRNGVHLTIVDDDQATFIARKNNNEFNSNALTFTGINLNTWYDVDLRATSCATTSGSITISGGDLAAPVSTSASTGTAPLGSWTYFGVGTTSADGGDLYIDDLCIGGIECVGATVPDPPTGVYGQTTRVVSDVSPTGKVALSWLLSPDDSDQDVGDFTYRIYRDDVEVATDTVDEFDGDGVRGFNYYFSGPAPLGEVVFHITGAGDLESGASCTITVDLDDLGSDDACGLEVPILGAQPAEFDEGLAATIAEFGFVSAESQMLFSMILIGMATVATGAATKLLAPSKWKNWLVVGVGITIGTMAVIIGFLDLWVAIVATMLGIFAVRGAGEARNTFFEIRERLRAEAAQEHPNQMEIVNLDAVEADPKTGAKVVSDSSGALVVDPSGDGEPFVEFDSEQPEGAQPSPEAVEAVRESIDALNGREGAA